MAMMYKIIAEALDKADLLDKYHPQDYLNFYCLGKREASSPESSAQIIQTSENRALVWCFLLSETINNVASILNYRAPRQ